LFEEKKITSKCSNKMLLKKHSITPLSAQKISRSESVQVYCCETTTVQTDLNWSSNKSSRKSIILGFTKLPEEETKEIKTSRENKSR
jgi:hypothetical protein